MKKVILIGAALVSVLFLSGCDMNENGESAEVHDQGGVPVFTVHLETGKSWDCFWIDKGVGDSRTGGPFCWETK